MTRRLAVLMLNLVLFATSAPMFTSPATAISEDRSVSNSLPPATTLSTPPPSSKEFCVAGPDQQTECFSSSDLSQRRVWRGK